MDIFVRKTGSDSLCRKINIDIIQKSAGYVFGEMLSLDGKRVISC